MAETTIVLELGLIIGIAAVLALIGRMVKQPTIIAYLITGIVIGPLFLNLLHSTELIQIFAHLGVAFLLFIVGVSLDFRVLKEVGGVATTVGIGQVVITGAVGFLLAVWFGLSSISALFLAAALAISSTVVIMKLLADKRELDTLHGKIALGVLIVQDFVAALAILIVPIIGSVETFLIVEQLAKGALLIGSVFVFSHLIIPGVLSIAAKNQEILFLFSIGWALLVAMLFEFFGFSIEIGALIAGMSLASSKFSIEIGSKIKSLREFFVIIHLVFFGSLLVGPINQGLLVEASIFSLLILVGNPLIVMAFMKSFGYKKQTNFLTGIGIAQISELSLILVFMGFTLGIVPQATLSLTILVALITIGLSSYSISYSHKLYKLLSPALGIFDGKGRKFDTRKRSETYNVILFGHNRIGFNILRALAKKGKKCLVVDYNPKAITTLARRGVDCVYGDANDPEFLKDLKLRSAKIILSTIPDVETNLEILQNIKNKKTLFIPTSHTIADTKKLYEAGADYVIMPHFLGGNYMAHLLLRKDFSKKMLDKEGAKQLRELEERLFEGHDHPKNHSHK